MMEWRIRESGHGGFVAERGIKHEGGVLSPSGIGFTLPAFIVYESARFDTKKEAERFIRRKGS